MIKLKNILLLRESMNVMVKGVAYDRNMGDLNDVCNAILDKVLSPILHKLPPDQQAYFQKNGVGFYETIVPDGSYFSGDGGGTGVINFYISGLMSGMKDEVLDNVLGFLTKLGIKYDSPKVEQSGVYKSQVVRIPVTQNPNGGERPPEINLSNVNAYQIFHNVLQYEGEHNFSMPAKDLIQRIVTILKHDPEWIKKNVINRTDSDWPDAERDDQEVDNPHLDIVNQLGAGGARMIGMGLDEDAIMRRLLEILELAKWAVQKGHTEITVG
jgi:hypothetical protein